jgi:hypothetical protein
MTTEDTWRRIAAHEVLHSLYSTSCGIAVEQVSYHPKAESLVCWPFAPSEFYARYRANPYIAMQELKQVLGVLYAPYVVQKERPAGVDQTLLAQWQKKWNAYRLLTRPENICWERLLLDVRAQVVGWYYQAGRPKAVEALTDALLTHGTLSGPTWHALVRQHAPTCLRSLTYAPSH